MTAEKALAELAAIHRSVTRATGRPPAGPFRAKEVPGWSYDPLSGAVAPDGASE